MIPQIASTLLIGKLISLYTNSQEHLTRPKLKHKQCKFSTVDGKMFKLLGAHVVGTSHGRTTPRDPGRLKAATLIYIELNITFNTQPPGIPRCSRSSSHSLWSR